MEAKEKERSAKKELEDKKRKRSRFVPLPKIQCQRARICRPVDPPAHQAQALAQHLTQTQAPNLNPKATARLAAIQTRVLAHVRTSADAPEDEGQVLLSLRAQSQVSLEGDDIRCLHSVPESDTIILLLIIYVM